MLYNDILDAWKSCCNLKVVAEGLEKLLFSKWSLKTGPAEIIAVMEMEECTFNQGRWQKRRQRDKTVEQASAESWWEREQCLSASVLMLKRTLTWQI